MDQKSNVIKTATLSTRSMAGKLTVMLQQFGDFCIFGARFFKEVFQMPFEAAEFVRQTFFIGNRSFGLVVTTGFIMGIVLTLQSKPTLEEFGAESWLPEMVAISIIREIGPVITALICAGKVGSGIGAELGAMKVSEQIDAMEVSGSNPYKYLVVTRVMATSMMLPILVLCADLAGIIGSFAGANIEGSISFQLFINRAIGSVEFSDLIPATLKSIVFGFFIGLIGCYKGFNANKGTESVGIASNESVIAASLMVFVIDVIAVQLTTLIIS